MGALTYPTSSPQKVVENAMTLPITPRRLAFTVFGPLGLTAAFEFELGEVEGFILREQNPTMVRTLSTHPLPLADPVVGEGPLENEWLAQNQGNIREVVLLRRDDNGNSFSFAVSCDAKG